MTLCVVPRKVNNDVHLVHNLPFDYMCVCVCLLGKLNNSMELLSSELSFVCDEVLC